MKVFGEVFPVRNRHMARCRIESFARTDFYLSGSRPTCLNVPSPSAGGKNEKRLRFGIFQLSGIRRHRCHLRRCRGRLDQGIQLLREGWRLDAGLHGLRFRRADGHRKPTHQRSRARNIQQWSVDDRGRAGALGGVHFGVEAFRSSLRRSGDDYFNRDIGDLLKLRPMPLLRKAFAALPSGDGHAVDTNVRTQRFLGFRRVLAQAIFGNRVLVISAHAVSIQEMLDIGKPPTFKTNFS